MDESHVSIKNVSFFQIKETQALILLLEDIFSSQSYLSKGVNLRRGFATYLLLLIVENSPLKQQ